MKKNLKTATLCVQGGYEPKNGEPIELPIIQSTTFKYDSSDEMAMLFDLKKEGYFYTARGWSGGRAHLQRPGCQLLCSLQYL